MYFYISWAQIGARVEHEAASQYQCLAFLAHPRTVPSCLGHAMPCLVRLWKPNKAGHRRASMNIHIYMAIGPIEHPYSIASAWSFDGLRTELDDDHVRLHICQLQWGAGRGASDAGRNAISNLLRYQILPVHAKWKRTFPNPRETQKKTKNACLSNRRHQRMKRSVENCRILKNERGGEIKPRRRWDFQL